MRLTLTLAALAALTACAHPEHLQYDHGNSYEAAFSTQADLTRESVEDAVYELNGVEGIEIRARAAESTTDQESGKSEVTAEQ
ncbi:MAG: hypothetical protein H6741_14085 [Alphaproteobacteria bacterium]|nr:hypothetical protein [Alphaproteobacteria bacterium]MCB9793844.1 hypothetical protein [Alphaproteobacteria bacterium]